jgi:urease accessory protein
VSRHRRSVLLGYLSPLWLWYLLLPVPASAHTGTGSLGGFGSGFLHPVTGYDHVLAMVAVGIWGAQLGMPLVWVLPVTFPLVMALSGMLGGLGLPLPGVETGIDLSVLVLGAMIALAVRPPVWLAAAVVAAWAVFHGYAHGAELPETADPFAYGIGFVLATGLLHGVGIGVGTIVRWPIGASVLRLAGATICAAGFWLLLGNVAA